jgi:hypothetical protein
MNVGRGPPPYLASLIERIRALLDRFA